MRINRSSLTGIATMLMVLSGLLGAAPTVAKGDACTNIVVHDGFVCVTQGDGGYTVTKEGQPVPDGKVLKKGQNAVWEVRDDSAKTDMLNAGVVPKDIKVDSKAQPAVIAWAPYSSPESALKGLCSSTAKERPGDLPGYNVTVNGKSYSYTSCPNIKPIGVTSSNTTETTDTAKAAEDSAAKATSSNTTATDTTNQPTETTTSSIVKVYTFEWATGDLLREPDTCYMEVSDPDGHLDLSNASVHASGSFRASSKESYTRQRDAIETAAIQDPNNHSGKCDIIQQPASLPFK